jgi:arabinofuranosyltransferase
LNHATRLERNDWPWLLSLLLIGCLTLGGFAITSYHFNEEQGGVPLDDAWIHFQFARNLARGDGLSFNPGQPTAGSTAPLWTLLLAAAYFVGGKFPIAGQLLSAVCYLTTLAATYVLGKRLTNRPWTAWLAGAVVAVNGRMVWAGLSALETCLFATLSLLAIHAHLNDQDILRQAQDNAHRYRLRTAVLFGLAALARPEGYLLFALSLADFIAGDIPRATHYASRITHYVSRILLFSAIVLPYLIFSLRTSGHLLPNTYHAKAVFDFRPDLNFISLTSRYLILDNFLLLPFYILGLGALFRRASLLSLWSVGLPLVYAFLHAVLYQHGRYLMPLIPCNAVIGVAGLLEMQRLARLRRWHWRAGGGKPVSVPAVILLIIAGTAWRLPTMASEYGWNVHDINEMHVALGHWAAEHTPPDAVLALNDIGAIAYISEHPVVDLAGLITPEVVPLLHTSDRDSRLIELLAEREVQYVIIFPNWFPDLAKRRELEPVHQVTLEHRTIAGGETMIVYRTDWRR